MVHMVLNFTVVHLCWHGEEGGDDDGDDNHLGWHGEEGGHPKRHSRWDRVLVEPETHLVEMEVSSEELFISTNNTIVL